MNVNNEKVSYLALLMLFKPPTPPPGSTQVCWITNHAVTHLQQSFNQLTLSQPIRHKAPALSTCKHQCFGSGRVRVWAPSLVVTLVVDIPRSSPVLPAFSSTGSSPSLSPYSTPAWFAISSRCRHHFLLWPQLSPSVCLVSSFWGSCGFVVLFVLKRVVRISTYFRCSISFAILYSKSDSFSLLTLELDSTANSCILCLIYKFVVALSTFCNKILLNLIFFVSVVLFTSGSLWFLLIERSRCVWFAGSLSLCCPKRSL